MDMFFSTGTRAVRWYYASLGTCLALSFGFSAAAAFSVRDSGGCGQSHDFVGTTKQFSISSGGLERQYRIHLPSSYDPNIATPLILSYHGATETAEFHENQTQFSNEDYNPSMIAVYPQGDRVSQSMRLVSPFTPPFTHLRKHSRRTCQRFRKTVDTVAESLGGSFIRYTERQRQEFHH